MKNFKTTLVFAIVVMGVGAFAYWEYQQSEKETEAKAKEDLVFNLEREQVSEIDFKSTAKALNLKKIDGTWQMLAPIEDKADSEAVDQWLTSLLDQKAKDLSEQLAGQDIDWSKYYVTDKSQTLTLKAKTPTEEVEEVKLVFGDSNAFDGSYYIRHDDRLLLGDVSWAQALNRSPKDLRNKDLYEPTGEIMAIEIDLSKKKPFKVELRDKNWRFADGKSVGISSSSVNEYLATLKTLNANNIVADDLSPATLKKYKLQNPSVKITVSEEGSGSPFVLTVGEIASDKNEVHVYTSKRDTVYAILKTSAEKLRASEDFFRDGKKPFEVELSQVDKLQLKDGKKTRVFEKQDGEWKATQLGPEEEFAPTKMESFLNRFKDLEARVFMPKSRAKSLGNQTLEFFKGSDPVLKLEIGADFTSEEIPSTMNPLRYVKSSQSPEALGVRATVIQGIMRELPVQPKKGENTEKPVLGQ